MSIHIDNRHLIKSVLFIGITCLLIGCSSPVRRNMQPVIDSIAARFVPDQRIGICKILSTAGKDGRVILTGETTDSLAKQQVIKTLYNRGISLIDSIIILPDTLKNERFMGLATLSVINLRKEPDHAAELVSQAILGTPVLILKNTNSWILVQTPDNYIAWTEKSSVKMMSRQEMNEWKNAERVIFIENSGWIYDKADDSGIVGDLVAGSILQKTGESTGYVNVILPDGRKGVVLKKAVESLETFRAQVLNNADGVLSRASSLMGVPYLWGGTSAKGVDCSGFVRTVYFMNGLILQRDASLQALHGFQVDLSKGYDLLKKGDLLFFGSRVNSKLRVTHVAIYMGDSEYINSSGRVMINSLDSTRTDYNGYRKRSLLLARRIIDVDNDPGIVPIKKHLWY